MNRYKYTVRFYNDDSLVKSIASNSRNAKAFLIKALRNSENVNRVTVSEFNIQVSEVLYDFETDTIFYV